MNTPLNNKTKLCYITASAPFSKKESYILKEAMALSKHAEVVIVPLKTGSKAFQHTDLEILAAPIFSLAYFTDLVLFIFNKRMHRILTVLFQSRNLTIFTKNLAVLPKSLHLAKVLKENRVSHIHAHWGGTTSTMALIIHLATGIPFSFTLHRWDIPENNLLNEKVKHASFVRTISLFGEREAKQLIAKQLHDKIVVLHMGVDVPTAPKKRSAGELKIVIVANLVKEKGVDKLLNALAALEQRDIKYKADIYGEGPERSSLKAKSKNLNLKQVRFMGFKPNDLLIKEYSKGRYNLMVLPSLIEGIPVSLMEAMANGIRVIASDVGGISELITDKNNGFLLKQIESSKIAEAIINSRAEDGIERNAFETIRNDFNIEQIAKRLAGYFQIHQK